MIAYHGTIRRHCLGHVAPQSGWPRGLRALLDDYPDIPRVEMGFPANWIDGPIWKEVGDGG